MIFPGIFFNADGFGAITSKVVNLYLLPHCVAFIKNKGGFIVKTWSHHEITIHTRRVS